MEIESDNTFWWRFRNCEGLDKNRFRETISLRLTLIKFNYLFNSILIIARDVANAILELNFSWNAFISALMSNLYEQLFRTWKLLFILISYRFLVYNNCRKFSYCYQAYTGDLWGARYILAILRQLLYINSELS